MSKIAKNISHLRKLKSFTQEQFADELGIKKSRLGAYEESRSAPPIDMLIKLSDYFKLPIDILVRRDLTKSNNLPFIEVGSQRVLFPITVDEKNRDQIEVVHVKASAGYVQGYGDPEFINDLPKMKLPVKQSGKLRAFPIKGDSMPPLQDGAFVVGRFVENLEEIKDGSTCIVVTADQGVVYKRVYQKEKVLELHSDNPIYQSYTVPKGEVMEVWAFVSSISLNAFEQEQSGQGDVLKAIQELRADVLKLKSDF